MLSDDEEEPSIEEYFNDEEDKKYEVRKKKKKEAYDSDYGPSEDELEKAQFSFESDVPKMKVKNY